ncbi:MAG TPA: hypothetical protein VGZ27_02145 [Vicinamibacterales bacterium]|jgi:hypothetical protein|nr:hypothetical protein [Vicinamibacterales bacterium]
MSMFRNLTLAAAALTLSIPAFAAQAAPAAPAKATAPAPASAPAKATKTAKASKTTSITASGTVSKFDAASNTLTVTTPKGDVAFMVDSSASIMAGGKKVMASDLPNQVGHKVVVHYTEANGMKTAQSVRVGTAAAKTASAKKTTAATKKS